MAQWLKQSTAVTVKLGPFVDATDGVTALTALTISQADIRLSKNGGNIAQSNDATGATHDELGYYDVPLDATDTNTLGTLRVAVSESGALPVWQDFMVVPANVWDSFFGADALQVDVAQWLGTAAATPTTAGVPEVDVTFIAGSAVSTTTAQLGVNVVQVSGDAGAADNLEAAYDGTGYQIIRTGTAQAGANDSITLDASASASDDFYNNTIVQILSGTGANQARFISDYNGTTKVASVSPNWVTNPANDSVFRLLPFGSIPGASAPTAGEVADAVWDEARAGHVAAGSFGEGVVVNSIATGAITATAIAADAITAAKVAADVHAEAADAVLDEAMSGHTTVGTLGQILQPARTGTAQAGTASTITLDASASATDDLYEGGLLQITSGTGAGQARLITDYNGTTKAATVNSNWVTNPSSDSGFVLWPGDSVTSVWDELRSAHSGTGSFGEGIASVQGSVTGSVASVTGNVGGSVASVTGAVGSVTGNVGGNVTGSVGSLAAQAKADVNAEVDTAISDAALATAANLETVDTVVDAVKAKTDSLTFTTANKVDATLQAAGDFAQGAADKVWATAARTLTQHPAIKKNTASQRIQFLMVDATDGVTPELGLTVTAERSIDGGAFSAATGTVAEIADGWYALSTSAADTNGDSLIFQFSAAGAGTRTYWVLTG